MLTKGNVTFDSLFNRCTLPISILLNDREKNQILENINIVEYNRRDIILKQNSRTSHILYLASGLVKISRELRKGKHIILKLQNSGDFIGISSILGSESFDFTVSAVEECTAVYIDVNIFTSILERNGLFCIDIARQISKNTIFNVNRLSGLLYKQLPGRVADLILYFAENIYHSNTYKFPLTRQELAELCGTTKESLIRTLSEFNHDRIIEMERSSVKIISVDILKTLSRLG